MDCFWFFQDICITDVDYLHLWIKPWTSTGQVATAQSILLPESVETECTIYLCENFKYLISLILSSIEAGYPQQGSGKEVTMPVIKGSENTGFLPPSRLFLYRWQVIWKLRIKVVLLPWWQGLKGSVRRIRNQFCFLTAGWRVPYSGVIFHCVNKVVCWCDGWCLDALKGSLNWFLFTCSVSLWLLCLGLGRNFPP